MSYSRNYRPSASLIHEIRMIAQSFFAQRTTASIFGSRKSESSPLLCVDCVRARAIRPQKAMVIDNGKSVCQSHFTL